MTPETVLKALYASWGPETLYDIKRPVTKEDINRRLRKNGVTPRGIVITRIGDAEFAGGLLLAARHGQPIDFMELLPGTTRDEKGAAIPPHCDLKVVDYIRKDIIARIVSWGYEYRGIGTGIDYITLALNLPVHYNSFSVDDAINREEQTAIRAYAYCGRLFEGEGGMALYQANCAAFLPVHKALLFDRWPANWRYGMGEAAWSLYKNIPVTHLNGNDANMEAWRALMEKGNAFDLIFVQSSGGATNWMDGTVDDIPDSAPTIVHFSHSNGAQSPHSRNTIGGRWLSNGAFIYLGSLSEPQNRAFQKPADIAEAIERGEPLGKAFQQKEKLGSRFAVPWKLIYFGDPMYTVRFAVRPDDGPQGTLFQRGLLALNRMNFREAAAHFENFIASSPGSGLAATAQDFLMRTYDILFMEYASQKYPVQKYLTDSYVKDWYCGTPSEAQKTHDDLVYLRSRELCLFLTNLAAQKAANSYVNGLIAGRIRALEASAPFIKEWAVAGPFTPDAEKRHPEIAEPSGLAVYRPIAFDNTVYPWSTLSADPATNTLSLTPQADQPPESFAYAAALVAQSHDGPADFAVRSSARWILYVNNARAADNFDALAAGKEAVMARVSLRNGINKAVFKIYRGAAEWKLSCAIAPAGGSGFSVPLPLERNLSRNSPLFEKKPDRRRQGTFSLIQEGSPEKVFPWQNK